MSSNDDLKYVAQKIQKFDDCLQINKKENVIELTKNNVIEYIIEHDCIDRIFIYDTKNKKRYSLSSFFNFFKNKQDFMKTLSPSLFL